MKTFRNADLEHQQLADELNRRAEKKRIAELDGHSEPFFILVIVFCLIALYGVIG